MQQPEKKLDWNDLIEFVQKVKLDQEIEKNEMKFKINELQTENQHLLKQNQLQKRQLFVLRKQYQNAISLIAENNLTLKTEQCDDESISSNSLDIIEQDDNKGLNLNQIFQECDIKDILDNLKNEQSKIISNDNSFMSNTFQSIDDQFFGYKNHLDCIRDLQCYKENKNEFIISVGEDGLTIIQDINDEYNKKILRSHLGPIFSLYINQEQQLFLTGGCEGWISLWNQQNGSILNTNRPKNLYLFEDVVSSIDMKYQYQNKILATSRQQITLIYDYNTDVIDLEIEQNYIFSKYDLLQNSQILFSNDSFAQIDFYDTEKQKFNNLNLQLQKLDQINSLDFNIDRNCYLFCSDYGKILLYNQGQQNIEQRFNYDGIISKCLFIDNNRFAITGQEGLSVYDIRQHEHLYSQQIGLKKFNENITSIDINNNKIFLGCADGFIYKTEINQNQDFQNVENQQFILLNLQIYNLYSFIIYVLLLYSLVQILKVSSYYPSILISFILQFHYSFLLFF